MDDIVWLWIAFFIFLILSYWYLSSPKNLPPGSAGLPILGYLPFMDKQAHLTFEKLGRKYGNIFHLYLGSRLVVVLNDYTAIREAFIKQAEVFAGRPAGVNFTDGDNLGVMANDGDYWKQHRRFILTNLRDYGVGKLALEPLLLNEIQYFLKEIRKKNGESFAIKPLLSNSVANNIHILVTGKRYEYDHPTMQKIIMLLKKGETTLPALNLAMFFPWIAKLPGSDFILKKHLVMGLFKILLQTIEEIIDTVKREYREGQHENYVYSYVNEKNARFQMNGEEDIFTDLGLVHISRDLLIAGTETTATSLHWALLYLTLNPGVQRRVQEEIERVIGGEREPSYNDRSNMPYTEATIMELHRITSLVPLSIAHRCMKEATVLGHRIPKDTMIVPNLWAVHHDPDLWGDPHNFRPERFIGSDGQTIKSEYLIPFSAGKRSCVGEPLARMEVFLYFVSLVQHFQFVPPDGIMPSLDSIPGIARRPKFQNICAKLR